MSKNRKRPKKSKFLLRKSRHFSETFRKDQVEKIIAGEITVLQISRLYKVSTQSVYRWLAKYSKQHPKGVIQVIQMESEEKINEKLRAHIAKLEQIVGQQQVELEYHKQLKKVRDEELTVDQKKNLGTKPSKQ